jgi:hypothetical protein
MQQNGHTVASGAIARRRRHDAGQLMRSVLVAGIVMAIFAQPLLRPYCSWSELVGYCDDGGGCAWGDSAGTCW